MAIYERGMDVSRYQGTVNWAAVAAAGMQFVLVRVGSSNGGQPYVDPYFRRNVEGARAAGLKTGAYYFTYARTEEQVAAELETFLPALEGLRMEYPVFVDVEADSLAGLGRARLTGLVKYAMDILDQRGWLPGWYTYTAFAQQYLDAAALADYPLWIADYRGYVGLAAAYDLWQYTAAGQVDGVDGNVDLNYSYRNFLPLLQQAGLNGFGGGPAMTPVSGKVLEVTDARTEYFASPDVNDVVGYLPLGQYPAQAVSDGAWQGYRWATFLYGDTEYWTALLADRVRLVDAPGDTDGGDAAAELADLRERVARAGDLLAEALDLLDGEPM
ncbi:MAG: endolysin [Oscillospiraceae bacterium]|nr:endolysin [Oscillospiraceae bacterium]